MQLATSIKESFLDLFYNELECEIEQTNSRLNLRILRIENNQFTYDELIKKLSNAVITYSLSKKQFTDFVKDERYGELNKLALNKFRDYSINDGEAGEVLLYCFLESHLKAPKILTKLEIKTARNDYVKGSDGIHLLQLGLKRFQIIFGESKLDASLTASLSNAFKSIHDFITRDKDNIYHEMSLLDSQLCKESLDEDMYQFVKSIVFPKANGSNSVVKDNAFAIFAGFDINPSEEELKMKNDDFRILIRKRIKEEVEKKQEHIREKISEYKLFNHTFYVYVFPFMKIDETRKKIIKEITHPVL
ncbi:MAG: DUF1837 domain-containing protein [Bacteroidetes bacterium]|nr:MAG: DUF1837 domain-containing protein [Bacteroidota bacterium]